MGAFLMPEEPNEENEDNEDETSDASPTNSMNEANIVEPEKHITVETETPTTVETEKPTVENETPTTVETEKPTVETEKPMTVETEKPTVETEKPTVETEKPMTVETEKPMTVETEKPIIVETEKPITVETEKPITVETEEPENDTILNAPSSNDHVTQEVSTSSLEQHDDWTPENTSKSEKKVKRLRFDSFMPVIRNLTRSFDQKSQFSTVASHEGATQNVKVVGSVSSLNKNNFASKHTKTFFKFLCSSRRKNAYDRVLAGSTKSLSRRTSQKSFNIDWGAERMPNTPSSPTGSLPDMTWILENTEMMTDDQIYKSLRLFSMSTHTVQTLAQLGLASSSAHYQSYQEQYDFLVAVHYHLLPFITFTRQLARLPIQFFNPEKPVGYVSLEGMSRPQFCNISYSSIELWLFAASSFLIFTFAISNFFTFVSGDAVIKTEDGTEKAKFMRLQNYTKERFWCCYRLWVTRLLAISISDGIITYHIKKQESVFNDFWELFYKGNYGWPFEHLEIYFDAALILAGALILLFFVFCFTNIFFIWDIMSFYAQTTAKNIMDEAYYFQHPFLYTLSTVFTALFFVYAELYFYWLIGFPVLICKSYKRATEKVTEDVKYFLHMNITLQDNKTRPLEIKKIIHQHETLVHKKWPLIDNFTYISNNLRYYLEIFFIAQLLVLFLGIFDTLSFTRSPPSFPSLDHWKNISRLVMKESAQRSNVHDMIPFWLFYMGSACFGIIFLAFSCTSVMLPLLKSLKTVREHGFIYCRSTGQRRQIWHWYQFFAGNTEKTLNKPMSFLVTKKVFSTLAFAAVVVVTFMIQTSIPRLVYGPFEQPCFRTQCVVKIPYRKGSSKPLLKFVPEELSKAFEQKKAMPAPPTFRIISANTKALKDPSNDTKTLEENVTSLLRHQEKSTYSKLGPKEIYEKLGVGEIEPFHTEFQYCNYGYVNSDLPHWHIAPNHGSCHVYYKCHRGQIYTMELRYCPYNAPFFAPKYSFLPGGKKVYGICVSSSIPEKIIAICTLVTRRYIYPPYVEEALRSPNG